MVRGPLSTFALLFGCALIVGMSVIGTVRHGSAASVCPSIPTVFWWTNSTHERVKEYVKWRYGGSWNDYLAAWERRLTMLRGIQQLGSKVVIQNNDITLGGRGLELYLEVLARRVKVMQCLAKEAIGLEQPSVSKAGQKIASSLKCLSCHGETGNSDNPFIPNLAGQGSDYLRARLWFFRDSPTPTETATADMPVRHDRLMTAVARRLMDHEISNIAAYFANLPCRTTGLAKETDPPPKTTRCAACHGGGGQSQRAGIPNLAGQKTSYLRRQMSLLAKPMKDNHMHLEEIETRYHGMMIRQVGLLSSGEMDELAQYYSELPCR